jgi:FAD:protein FMN transferase
MQDTRLIMGMPITVKIIGARKNSLNEVFNYFVYVDNKFSPYKKDSEINNLKKDMSSDMHEVLDLCEKTKVETNGYFNIEHNGRLDPSGLVKGWAILKAANLIKRSGFKDFYIEAGGDIEVGGKTWTLGIRNPFNIKEIVKVVSLKNQGIATSGTYFRGQHVYNPLRPKDKLTDIVSLTVIGPNVYEADRFATAAFAMGKAGIEFIENLNGFEGYSIDKSGMAAMTSGFNKYAK